MITHLKTYRYNIDHLEHITHTSLNATTFVAAYGKYSFDYRLWEDKSDTCLDCLLDHANNYPYLCSDLAHRCCR